MVIRHLVEVLVRNVRLKETSHCHARESFSIGHLFGYLLKPSAEQSLTCASRSSNRMQDSIQAFVLFFLQRFFKGEECTT